MRMVLLAVIAATVFEVFVVVFAASADKTQVRNLPKWAWVLVCLVVPVIGPIAYLVYGRPIAGSATYRPAAAPTARPKRDSRGFGYYLKTFLGIGDEDYVAPNLPADFKYREETKPRKGPVAPDDDPEFLRELDELLKRQSSGEPQGEGEKPASPESDEPGDSKPTEPGTPQ